MNSFFHVHSGKQTIRNALCRRHQWFDPAGRTDREGTASKFTERYKVHLLVWYQEFADIDEAIQREKTTKEWPRAWKITIIERENPHWADLFPGLPGMRPVRNLLDS